MMLRASIEIEGGDVDLRAITDSEAAVESAIPGAEALVAFANATLGADEAAITKVRDRVREELGTEALVDAAGVIGNFERMVRIADGIGIPLDTVVNVGTESIRQELGIDGYVTGERTAKVTGVQRLFGRLVQPIVMRLMQRRARKGLG